MTREEAIEILENGGWWELLIPITTIEGRIEEDKLHEALDMALSALRTVSREQVEKVWRGEWEHTHSSDNFWTEVWKCSHCDFEDNYGECFDFCPFCGAAQTDEAVEMVMERLEAMKDEN